jgi:hypothetical protein
LAFFARLQVLPENYNNSPKELKGERKKEMDEIIGLHLLCKSEYVKKYIYIEIGKVFDPYPLVLD